jgi:hypothetical protein
VKEGELWNEVADFFDLVEYEVALSREGWVTVQGYEAAEEFWRHVREKGDEGEEEKICYEVFIEWGRRNVC